MIGLTAGKSGLDGVSPYLGLDFDSGWGAQAPRLSVGAPRADREWGAKAWQDAVKKSIPKVLHHDTSAAEHSWCGAVRAGICMIASLP